MLNDMPFAQWLKRKRKDKDLTLRELAKELGIKFPYLSQLESNMIKPSEDLAKRIAKFFGEDEETVVFLARDIPKLIAEIKAKYPKNAPAYFRRVLEEK